MANEVNITNSPGTVAQIVAADHATDFTTPTAANDLTIGTYTDLQLDLTSLAANGGARQSAKTGDLGDSRPSLYTVDACIEFTAAPTDNDGTVDFYWCSSPNSTAANGNAAGLTGSDAAFTDTTGNLGQLQFIGSLTVRNAAACIGHVGNFTPRHRYGILVVVNNCGTALIADANEHHVIITPMVYEPGPT